MQVKNKWKSFAMGQVMSSWTDKITAYEVYDAIYNAEVEELEELFEKHDILPWQVYEDWELVDIRDQLCGLAEDAQQYDNLENDNA